MKNKTLLIIAVHIFCTTALQWLLVITTDLIFGGAVTRHGHEIGWFCAFGFLLYPPMIFSTISKLKQNKKTTKPISSEADNIKANSKQEDKSPIGQNFDRATGEEQKPKNWAYMPPSMREKFSGINADRQPKMNVDTLKKTYSRPATQTS